MALLDEVLQEAVALYTRVGSQRRAARMLGIAQSTLNERLRLAREKGIDADGEIDSGPSKDEEVFQLKETIAELKREINNVRRETLTTDKIRAEIFKLSRRTADPPEWLCEPEKPERLDPGTPLLFLSDFHWSETVDPLQVGCFNEFNLDIGQQRLERAIEKTLLLCQQCIAAPGGHPGIVVALGGDMVSGDIHEELSETNEEPTIPALLNLFNCLVWALDMLAGQFGRVFVPCVVGNHARTTKKPRHKNAVYTNFDWLLYNLLESHFKNKGDDRIRFQIPEETDAHFSIYGHRYCMTHGDKIGTRGGDGIIGALGPIMRGKMKMTNALAPMDSEFDTLLMGHWHQYIALPGLICNGSLKGYDEYSKDLRFKPQRPVQSLHFTHPTNGIIHANPLYLDDGEVRPGAKWVSWKESA